MELLTLHLRKHVYSVVFFSDDREWKNAITESCTFQMPSQLGDISTTFVFFENDNVNPTDLWIITLFG